MCVITIKSSIFKKDGANPLFQKWSKTLQYKPKIDLLHFLYILLHFFKVEFKYHN